MYPQHIETNPHFLPQPPKYPQLQDPRSRLPPYVPAPHHGTFVPPSLQPPHPGIPSGYDIPQADHFPTPTQPRSKIHPKTRTHGGKHAGGMPPPQIHQGRHYIGQHEGDPVQQPRLQTGKQHVGQQGQPQHSPSIFRLITSRKTKPIAWLIAAFCALFWIIVIVGGLAVLIVHLVYRPRLPKFDISSATLNVAYLDMGYLLNADLTLLGNFTNPNKKVNVDFSYVLMDLYFEQNLIAATYIEPFTAMSSQSMFENIHMFASQVRLSIPHSQALTGQMNSGRVTFDVKGLFRARLKLGGVLRYSYWLHSQCTITVTGPPTGVLIGKRCTTKR